MDKDLEKIEQNKKRFLELCRAEIKRDGLENLLAWLEKTDFFTAPASAKYHGCYEGGLCEHHLNVYDAARKLEAAYPNAKVDHESVAITALFHDFCKIDFYKLGFRNVKEDGKWVQKEVWEIDDELPLGHGEKSCLLVQRYMKLTNDELLAIRWHMGGFDTAVKGGDYGCANAQSKTQLCSFLQIADLTAAQLIENKD